MKFWGHDKQPDAAYPAEIAEIEQATIVAFGGIGFANRMPAEAEAYYTLGSAIADGADLSAELNRLLEQATPAGRIYAALLLEKADPAGAPAVWQKLQSDGSAVQTGGGCIIDATTVAEYAAEKSKAVS